MAQKGEGHGGDGIGALQHTSVRAQPSLANCQLSLLHRREGAGWSRSGLCSSNYHVG